MYRNFLFALLVTGLNLGCGKPAPATATAAAHTGLAGSAASTPTTRPEAPTSADVLALTGECLMLIGRGGSAVNPSEWMWGETDLEAATNGLSVCAKASATLDEAITRSLEQPTPFTEEGFAALQERTQLLSQQVETHRNLAKARQLFTTAGLKALESRRAIPHDTQWLEDFPEHTGRDGLVYALLEINRDEGYAPPKMPSATERQKQVQTGIDNKYQAWLEIAHDPDQEDVAGKLHDVICASASSAEGFLSLPHYRAWLPEEPREKLGCP